MKSRIVVRVTDDNPSPSVETDELGKICYIINERNFDFPFANDIVSPQSALDYIWNGFSWESNRKYGDRRVP